MSTPPETPTFRWGRVHPIDNPALWDGDDSFGLGLSPPTSVDLCRAKAAEAIGRFKIEVPA